jgi:hypothetical protein
MTRADAPHVPNDIEAERRGLAVKPHRMRYDCAKVTLDFVR